MKKRAVLSLSGGMDSTTLLLRLLREGYEVTVLSFNYGQKHSIELERAKKLISNLQYLGKFDLTHTVVDLTSITPLLNSNLVSGGEEVPEGHYEDENMKKTVVPNRNKMFSSIIQSVALSIANKYDCEVVIGMGIHAGDHDIYPDCRQEFRDADYQAFIQGNWDAERVTYYTPYLQLDKYGILQDGELSCEKLGVDFNMVYSTTMTSYKPIRCQRTNYWYSDCYSASSVERVEAFMKLGRPDPVSYGEISPDGVTVVPLSWEEVVKRVEEVLSNGKA